MTESFDYDLHLISLSGKNDRTMLCFHGYGDNYKVAKSLRKYVEATLISFNFPDYDIKKAKKYDPKAASFGTIKELLPALYVIKTIIIDRQIALSDLYGFSAGGGALINLIALLNTTVCDRELATIGIQAKEKEAMLSVIQKAVIILDSPLKSIEEIIDYRGTTEELEILAKNYRDNDLRPIDSLHKLKGLSLNVLIYFEEHDEVLSNRDDKLFIDRLTASQLGKVTVIHGNDGGHMVPHPTLWQSYSEITSQN